MDIRRFGLVIIALLSAGLVAGCRKSQPDLNQSSDLPASPKPEEPLAETVAQIHWLGKKRLAVETNAAHLMSIWRLPESETLGKQTLDKLALAPWRLLKGDAATNGAPTALLRSLLYDLVQEESYLEVRNFTNQPGEMVFAIRLDKERAGVWQTNLAAVIESLTGSRVTPTNGGWSLKDNGVPGLIELIRAGDWTVVGLAPEQNRLLADALARIQTKRVPFSGPATDDWLMLALDLSRAARALSLNWQFPADWPRISLSVVGDGANVQTRGELNFSTPLGLDLEPWNIPTNFIHDPLVSFTAIRGIKSLVSQSKAWKNLELGEAPNQFYLWGLGATPFQTYFAAPSASASNQVFQLTQRLLEKGGAWLASNAIGKFVKLDAGNGVRWSGLPFITPVLQSVTAGEAQFIKGGFFPTVSTNSSMPIELVYAVLTPTNLVGYDWEITGSRFDGWTGVGQALRISFGRPRMPAGSAGMIWLRAIKPRLGNSTTGVLMTNPRQLRIVRGSSIGLTAMELHLLADWLESPQFPRGVHTFLAPSDLPWMRSQPGDASSSPP